MCAQVYLTFYNPMDYPRPGDLPDPGIKPASPALKADSLPMSHRGSPYLSILEPKPWCCFCPLFFHYPMSIRKSYFIYSQNSILLTFSSFHLLCYHSIWNRYYLHMDFHNRVPAVLSGSTFHHSPDNPFFTLPQWSFCIVKSELITTIVFVVALVLLAFLCASH